MKSLSIVIPAYNMEKYLDECLKSMVRESILDLLEVIVVDDGSKDKTVEIARCYEMEYPQTFKVISKENGGHGSALNVGIEAAQGKYIRPIDADDKVNTDALEYLTNYLVDCNSDMIVTHYKKLFSKSGKVVNVRIKGVEYEQEYRLNDVAEYNQWYLYHHVMYRADILKHDNIKLSEHVFYDDMEYDGLPLIYVRTVTFVNRYIYYYRLEREGQSVEQAGFIRHRDDRVIIVERLCKFYEEYRNSFEENVLAHFKREMLWRILRQYEIYLSMPYDKKLMAEINDFSKRIMDASSELAKEAVNRRTKLLNQNKYFAAKVVHYGHGKWKKINGLLNRYTGKIRGPIKSFLKKYRPKPWEIRSDIPMHIRICYRRILKFLHLTWTNKEMRKLQEFKNIHAGERCFITCTGPSLTISDLELLNDEITFGVNSITKAYEISDWRPTYYVLVDVFAFGKYLEQTEIPGGKFCHKDAFFHYRSNPKTRSGKEHFCLVNYGNHTKSMMKTGKNKISKDIDVCVYDCFTVTNMAIQIAMYMGFKKIYIIGADCNYTLGPIHFIEMPDDKKKIATGRLPNATRLSITGYEWVKKYADEMGVEIYNVTRGGMLEVFPRKNLEDVLEEK